MPATRSKTKKEIVQAVASKPRVPPKAIPVTLLSGFLGAGKTTLLQHILRSDHGLRIAVVVNDIGAINVDASLIKQTHHLTRTHEKVIALQNGCICCTLRGDLLEELVRLSELQSFDYIIIESSGISEPEQVAETFDQRLAEQMEAMGEGGEQAGLDEETMMVLRKVKEAGGLEKFARLDTTVTVIDAFTLFHDFETADLLSARRDDVTPEDERTVSDLMVDQIEFADVIILNKIDMINAETKSRILTLVQKLNHRARILQSTHGRIPVREILNTGIFNLERAQTGYGWLQDLHAMTLLEVNGKKALAPRPETEEYNVRNFVYRRQRPFHPGRLFQLLHDTFILQLEAFDSDDEDEEDDDDDDSDDEEMLDAPDSSEEDTAMSSSPTDGSTSTSRTTPSISPSKSTTALSTPYPDIPPNDTILHNKRRHPLFAKLFRSKGEYHLATRPHYAGSWSQAGAMLTLTASRPWFCTLAPTEYETGVSEIDDMVKWDLEQGGEWGDRRQEIVFIGEGLDISGIEEVLDGCLLRDEEMGEWETVMRGTGSVEERMERLANVFDDGWPDWAVEEGEEGHEGHDHGHGGQEKVKHVITKNGIMSS